MDCSRIHLTRPLKTNNQAFKYRLKKTVVKYSIIFGIAFSYLIFVLCTGVRIPCLFYELTELQCPGCGITRMFVSLAKFDISSAFSYNPAVFITGPFIVAYLMCSEIKYVYYGNRSLGRWEMFLWIELFLLIFFGIFRNIF